MAEIDAKLVTRNIQNLETVRADVTSADSLTNVVMSSGGKPAHVVTLSDHTNGVVVTVSTDADADTVVTLKVLGWTKKGHAVQLGNTHSFTIKEWLVATGGYRGSDLQVIDVYGLKYVAFYVSALTATKKVTIECGQI